MPYPQIRCNVTLRQTAGLRDANCIPLELAFRVSLPYRQTHGPTLNGEYCSQKIGTKPGRVQCVST